MNKTKLTWKESEINYYENKMLAMLSYDMPEDVHQVANFAEIKLHEEHRFSRSKGEKGRQVLFKRYSGQAKCAVLTSIFM